MGIRRRRRRRSDRLDTDVLLAWVSSSLYYYRSDSKWIK